MKKGLVVGKFYPPHRGHSYLIDYATAHSDSVDVLVCDNPAYRISAERRANWLRTLHPNVTVHIIPDLNDDDDSYGWAQHTMQFLGYAPDCVFSSEDYGHAYARYMGAEHHLVDKQRTHIPIAATRVRNDVLKEWQYVHPVVRRDFALRVCVLGAESTGTTTLSKKLADHYHTTWVPEYGRYYTEALNDMGHEWHSQEFAHIAELQQQMEQQLAGESNGLLICDTNAFATRLWHDRYVGAMSDKVDEIAQKDRVDLYILTGDEIPFVQDGIRDGEHIRHDMHGKFIAELAQTDTPYIQVRGSVAGRLKAATAAIDTLLQKRVTI